MLYDLFCYFFYLSKDFKNLNVIFHLHLRENNFLSSIKYFFLFQAKQKNTITTNTYIKYVGIISKVNLI